MHPIENIMRTAMEQIKEMIDVNTIVGTPIVISGETMVLPVSKLCLGFVSGGGEYGASGKMKKCADEAKNDDERYPFAGTSIAGMSITPMAFLSCNDEEVKVLPAQYDCCVDKLIDQAAMLLKNVMKEKNSNA